MSFDADRLEHRFRERARRATVRGMQCSLRVVEETSLETNVRQDVPEPPRSQVDAGAMVTVVDGDGIGYAAAADLSDAGLDATIARAARWARLCRGRSVFANAAPVLPACAAVRYASPTRQANSLGKAQRLDLLRGISSGCRIDARIVDWQASIWTVRSTQLIVDLDGASALQEFDFAIPSLHVVAHADGRTQIRSWGGRYNGYCQQGGMDVVERSGFRDCGRATAEEALQLLTAPNCPTANLDLILLPDQMMLQIHESIGHPIELDRILGDERNFAGTSFVTLDMFGSYRYGSERLNVTYDPGVAHEFASFATDDEGSAAKREYLIRDGLLLRPLGGALSLQRAQSLHPGLEGVATARASSWNRPPIDRMSNLNVEAGDASLADMIAATEDGILMRTNASWSIDDSRNKFQFGCEWGRRIRAGSLCEVIRNPNYRGISATFWRSLAQVGDASTLDVMGTPFCGKGEPNQIIRVGHASPACRFTGVDVFGAEQ